MSPRERGRAGRIAIIGRPNVGKSTLLNALIGEPIAITSKHAQTTRDRIAGVLTEGDTQYVFLDTPGIHTARTRLGTRMNSVARETLDGADVVFFVTEPPTSGVSMRPVDLELLAGVKAGTPVLLVLNKVDRIKDKTKLFPILEAHASDYPFRAIVPLCALKSRGTSRLLQESAEFLPKGPKLFDAEEISDKPVRFFVAEFVREQILRRTHQEVPHGVAVTVERFDETPRVPRIDLAVHVDRESHKRIIIGAKGEMLKTIGQDARKRVEALYGKQVHLQIWVRVTPKWYETEKGLKEMGYGQDEGNS